MGVSLRDLKIAAVESILDSTKGDLPKPPSLEDVFKSASILLCAGCRRLGIPPVEEFGGLGQLMVPSELRAEIVGRVYEEGMLVNYQGTVCLVTSLFLQPPKGFLDTEDSFDRLHEYQVGVGKIIPVDSRIVGLSLIDARFIDDLKNDLSENVE